METDLIKIKKFSQEREDENWYFRTFLKGYDIKNLDSVVHKLFKQVSGAIDCTACGNCCKEIQPSLKKKDINKLSKNLNIPPDQFVTQYVDKDEGGDSIFKQISCPFLSNNRCTQYKVRPKDCVSYPHLHKKHFVSRLIGVIENYSICPIVFNVYEALKDKLMFEFNSFKDEMDEFDYY